MMEIIIVTQRMENRLSKENITMNIDIYIVYTIEDRWERQVCFSCATTRALQGEKIVTSIEDSPTRKCEDCNRFL